MSSPTLKEKKFEFHGKVDIGKHQNGQKFYRILTEGKKHYLLNVFKLNKIEKIYKLNEKEITNRLLLERKITNYSYPYVAKSFGSYLDEKNKVFYLSLDLFDTNLSNYCEQFYKLNKSPIPLAETVGIIQNVIQALDCLLADGRNCNNIQPKSILLSSEKKAFLCGFLNSSLAKQAVQTATVEPYLFMDFPWTTNNYESIVDPTLFPSGVIITDDVSRLGLLASYMLNYKNFEENLKIHKKSKNIVNFIQSIQNSLEKLPLDPKLIEIIKSMLELDPNNRPKIGDLRAQFDSIADNLTKVNFDRGIEDQNTRIIVHINLLVEDLSKKWHLKFSAHLVNVLMGSESFLKIINNRLIDEIFLVNDFGHMDQQNKDYYSENNKKNVFKTVVKKELGLAFKIETFEQLITKYDNNLKSLTGFHELHGGAVDAKAKLVQKLSQYLLRKVLLENVTQLIYPLTLSDCEAQNTVFSLKLQYSNKLLIFLHYYNGPNDINILEEFVTKSIILPFLVNAWNYDLSFAKNEEKKELHPFYYSESKSSSHFHLICVKENLPFAQKYNKPAFFFIKSKIKDEKKINIESHLALEGKKLFEKYFDQIGKIGIKFKKSYSFGKKTLKFKVDKDFNSSREFVEKFDGTWGFIDEEKNFEYQIFSEINLMAKEIILQIFIFFHKKSEKFKISSISISEEESNDVEIESRLSLSLKLLDTKQKEKAYSIQTLINKPKDSIINHKLIKKDEPFFKNNLLKLQISIPFDFCDKYKIKDQALKEENISNFDDVPDEYHDVIKTQSNKALKDFDFSLLLGCPLNSNKKEMRFEDLIIIYKKGLQEYLKHKWRIISLFGKWGSGKSFILKKIFDGLGENSQASFDTSFDQEGFNVKYHFDMNAIFFETRSIDRPVKIRNSSQKLISNQTMKRHIFNHMVQSFAGRYSHFCVLVFSKISSFELEEIIELAKTSQYKDIIVFHNWSKLIHKRDVRNLIDNELIPLFKLKRTQLPSLYNVDLLASINFSMVKETNAEYFLQEIELENKEKVSVIHLVTAKENSSAGQFYNKSGIWAARYFIMLNVKSIPSQVDIIEGFKKFFKENFRSYFSCYEAQEFTWKELDMDMMQIDKEFKEKGWYYKKFAFSANIFAPLSFGLASKKLKLVSEYKPKSEIMNTIENRLPNNLKGLLCIEFTLLGPKYLYSNFHNYNGIDQGFLLNDYLNFDNEDKFVSNLPVNQNPWSIYCKTKRCEYENSIEHIVEIYGYRQRFQICDGKRMEKTNVKYGLINLTFKFEGEKHIKELISKFKPHQIILNTKPIHKPWKEDSNIFCIHINYEMYF